MMRRWNDATGRRPFESDEDRLQVLFDLYAKMTAEEAEKGSLFESSKTKKKTEASCLIS